jgi:hypothetical protein
MKLVYEVTDRNMRGSKEWVFQIRIDSGGSWVMFTWDYAPSEDEVDEVKKIVLRSMEVFRKHLPPPAAIQQVERRV